jgi:phospholipid/cholesterol/gamma-HCH transport system substrate-binding protein
MKKYTHELLVGIFVIFGLACLGYITVQFGNVSIFGKDTYRLHAEFSSVSGLQVGNVVEMLGMEVGKVEGFRMDQDQQVIAVELQIRKDIKIYGDAVASIETAGLIGDRFLNIDPGGALSPLKAGDTILDTQPPVNINDLIGRFAFGEVKEE